jgi:hypothetical protein
MRRKMAALSRWTVAPALALAATASAWALGWQQDYALAQTTGLLEARPASATALTLITTAGDAPTKGTTATVTLPFDFLYYTTTVRQITISPFLFILPRGVASISSSQYGPATPSLPVTSGPFDGVIALCWNKAGSNPVYVNESPSTGQVYAWTSGVEPTRHFVISWENATVVSGGAPHDFTYQIHLYEGTGRIVFAYSGNQGGAPGPSVVGIDSPVDSRYTAVATGGQSTGNAGGAEVDYTFDPVRQTYSGTLHYDRIASDATGFGGVQPDAPLAGSTVELRSNGATYETATTAADGSFSIAAVGLPAGQSASLVVVAQNDACAVRPQPTSTAKPPAALWTVSGSLSFALSTDVGTVTLGAAADPTGSLRASLGAARDCRAAREWIARWTTNLPPQLDVWLDPTFSEATIYKPATSTDAAYLRIGSKAAPNPDLYDDAVVTKAYGRHVLASLVGAPSKAYDDRFDAAGDEENAFAEAFGYYLWATVSGSSTAVDGTSATTAFVRDLETPAAAMPKGPDVAGRVACALYDLVDPANEPSDTVDGSTTAERVFLVVKSMTAAPTVDTFMQAWIDAGYDGPGMSRAFVGSGAVVDDDLEPNDGAAEPSVLGTVPQVRTGLVLSRFNEDWFAVTVPAPASSLAVDVVVGNKSVLDATILDAAGASLSTSAYLAARGAVNAVTSGPVAAGTYLVRVRYVSGAAVSGYTFQAYVPPSLDETPVHDWTIGRNYQLEVGARGGIPPYALTTPSSFLPPGLVFDTDRPAVVGRPSLLGRYFVTLQLRDGGDPANVVQRQQFVTIHDVFKIPVAPFVAFAAGESEHAPLPTHEGTPPFAVSMTSGELPPGITFDGATLQFTGTTTPVPSTAFELDGKDVSGSTDHAATRAVVALQLDGKRTPAELEAGTDACGWWFDALEGSTVSFSVATVKGREKRNLEAALLAPDRTLVTTGAIRNGRGALSGSRLVCPQSGRCFLVASSGDSGPATQLVATVSTALPRSGKGGATSVSVDDTTTIRFGVLAGSTAIVKFAGDAKARRVARVVAVVSPEGVSFPFAEFVKSTAFGGTLKMHLPFAGTWTVVLGGVSTTGLPGRVSYSYVLRQLKGEVYSAK